MRRIRKALENKANMEDDRTTALESQLGQAKQIAEEADKKYEEVRRRGGNKHINWGIANEVVIKRLSLL